MARSKAKPNSVAINGKLGKESHTETVESQKRIRTPVFEYPELPKWEVTIYYLASFGIVAYGWYLIWQASKTYRFANSYGTFTVDRLPYFGRRIRDTTNYEWDQWRPLALKLIPVYLLNSLVFNVSEKLFKKRSRFLWELVTVCFSLAASSYVFTPYVVFSCTVQSFVLYVVARVTKRRLAVWLAAAPLLWLNYSYPGFLLPSTMRINGFLVLIMTSYRILAVIGYNLDCIKGKSLPGYEGFWPGLWRMYYFVSYLPYALSLIVLYSDFERQIADRESRQRDWREILFFAFRIAFWFLVVDYMLYFFYFDAMLQDLVFLHQVDKATLVSLGYATGQFFHMKYVVMFGLPAVFARLDNMQPLDGPICISRVALYSKMWRSFDRGLYLFFKEYIFVPICEPTFSVGRKIFGVLISYLFVLLWHGFTHQYVVWILINVFELFMEQAAKTFYLIPKVKQFRENHISDRNFARLLGWLQCFPYAFALYSTFYFLVGSEAGYVFVQRIFWEETVTFRYPFAILVTMGYFYNNSAMQCERYFSEKRKKEQEKLIKKDK